MVVYVQIRVFLPYFAPLFFRFVFVCLKLLLLILSFKCLKEDV